MRRRLKPGDVLAVEDDLAVGRLEQLDHRAAERRLAAAGLADEPERLARAQRQVDAVDGVHLADAPLEDAGRDREVLDETLDAEDLAAFLGALVNLLLGRRCLGRLAHASGSDGLDELAGASLELLGEVARRQMLASRPIGRSGGSSSRQRTRPCERKQRGWNGQPGGRLIRLGGWPGIGRSHSSSAVSFGRLSISPTVYGWRGVAEDRVHVAELDDLAGVHDDHAVGQLGDQAEVVRDQDRRGVRLVLRLLQHLEDLRLDRHVERRRRLVGDQHGRLVRDRHRDHRALAHAARELVRILVDAALGIRDADELQQLDRRASCRVVLDVAGGGS